LEEERIMGMKRVQVMFEINGKKGEKGCSCVFV
jgi:hypothetical protein